MEDMSTGALMVLCKSSMAASPRLTELITWYRTPVKLSCNSIAVPMDPILCHLPLFPFPALRFISFSFFLSASIFTFTAAMTNAFSCSSSPRKAEGRICNFRRAK
jgi:hypothetical protein